MNTNSLAPLTRDMILHRAPAIFAEKPADHVSPDYHFVSTAGVLDILAEEGWQPVHVSQQKVRIESNKDSTKHSVLLLRVGEDPKLMQLGGLLPSLNLVNSHNWASRMLLDFGMMRLVCGNGMLAHGAQFQSFAVRHDRIQVDIATVLQQFASSANLMLQTAERWNDVQLSIEQAGMFAAQAAKLRFGETSTTDHAMALMHTRRASDSGLSLWNTFNRIQENGMRGGPKFGSMPRKVRALSNIQASRDFNAGLFSLATTFEDSRN